MTAVGLVLLGVAMLVSGAVLAGLAAIAVGGVWVFGVFKKTEVAERARAAWANQRICLACTEQWVP